MGQRERHDTPTPSVFRSFPTAVAAVVTALALMLLLLVGGVSPAAAQDESSDESTDAEPTDVESTEGDAVDDEALDDETLRDGAVVYSQFCQSCHQPGGVGLVGSFPPLVDNENLVDAAYIDDVIENGREGELVVDGETYDGVMPSFSTLEDDDVDAVIAYIQSDFQAPSTPAPEVSSGPVAGSEVPGLTNTTYWVALLLVGFVGLLVFGPRLLSRNDRLNTPWFDTWLKTVVIVIAIVIAVAFAPNWVLQTSTVAGLSRPLQDLIGVSIWGFGLALCLGGLWYAHRDSRI